MLVTAGVVKEERSQCRRGGVTGSRWLEIKSENKKLGNKIVDGSNYFSLS